MMLVGLQLLLGSFILTVVPVMSRMFNFRELCTVNHSQNKLSAICDGNHIQQKDINFNERNIIHISSVDLSNFNSLTFETTAEISQIAIRNITFVNLSMSFQGLKDLKVESVKELILKDRISKEQKSTKIKSLLLTDISNLHIFPDNGSVWPVNTFLLNRIETLNLVESHLKVEGTTLSISRCNINMENTSLTLNITSVKINNSVLYIHKGGTLNVVESNQFIVEKTNIHLLENGSMVLENSQNATLDNNLFYGLENMTFKVLGSTSVNFKQNGFFLVAITDVLLMKEQQVSFVENIFDCNYCARNQEIVHTSLGTVGNTNYCYLNCSLSLNEFKKLLKENCYCVNPNQFIVEDKLCLLSPYFDLLSYLGYLLLIVLLINIVVLLYMYHHRKEYAAIDGFLKVKVVCSFQNSNAKTEKLASLSSSLYEEVNPITTKL